MAKMDRIIEQNDILITQKSSQPYIPPYSPQPFQPQPLGPYNPYPQGPWVTTTCSGDTIPTSEYKPMNLAAE